jgi:glycosyltransferase involved in cell wall biosynthesis
VSRRVAILVPAFWPEVRRGAERMAWELARGLDARGNSARIVTGHGGPWLRTVRDGVEVVRLPRPPDGPLRRRNVLEHLGHALPAYAELRRADDDVAVALHAADGLAAARWSKRTGRPSVLAYLGIPDRPGLTDRIGRLEATRRAAAGCTAVTALSEAAAAAFTRWLDVDARVIPPPVATDTFTPGGRRAEAPTIFCPAAGTDPRKRLDLLLTAFAQVRRARPEARLVLGGGVPKGAQPGGGAAGASRDLPDAVAAVALEGDDSLVTAYRSAWVTVLPSIGEAFGLVLAESLACGTPVVGTDDGAIPEVVDDSVGRLFARDDPEDLARALLDALELGGDDLAARCRARAETWSSDRCAAAYEALFDELG